MKQKYLDEAPVIIRQFLGYMQTIKGKSPKTVEEYYLDLRTFFRYLKQRRFPELAEKPLSSISILDVDLNFIKSVTLMQVYEYMNYLTEVRQNGPSARSRKCCSLRVFYNYLTTKAHLIEDNPLKELESPKLKKRLPKYLTLDQSIDLLKQVNGPFKERDYCILVLFLNCGMRLSELVSININDIRRGTNTLRLIGKGNKERIIYLNEACLYAIDNYLKVRPTDHLKDRYALFISKQRKRISPKTVQYLVKKYLSGINLGAGYSVHKLRHTAATLMYQQGNVDIRVLKEILGHENLGTTEIYTHLSNTQMEKAADANPLSHMIPGKSKKEKI
jgi:site-specific recombinase XerD